MTLTGPQAYPPKANLYLLGALVCMVAAVGATWFIVQRQTPRDHPGPASHEVVLQAPPGNPTYQNGPMGFAFSPPPGWLPVDRGREQIAARMLELPEGVHTVSFEKAGQPSPVRHINVMAQRARLPQWPISREDLGKVSRRMEAASGQHGMRACKVLKAQAIFVNELHGARVEYTADLAGFMTKHDLPTSRPTAVHAVHVHLRAKGRVYSITFSCAEHEYDALQPQFDRSLSSFRVLPARPTAVATQPALPP